MISTYLGVFLGVLVFFGDFIVSKGSPREKRETNIKSNRKPTKIDSQYTMDILGCQQQKRIQCHQPKWKCTDPCTKTFLLEAHRFPMTRGAPGAGPGGGQRPGGRSEHRPGLCELFSWRPCPVLFGGPLFLLARSQEELFFWGGSVFSLVLKRSQKESRCGLFHFWAFFRWTY